MRVEPLIPWLHLKVLPFALLGNLLDFSIFLLGRWLIGINQVVKQSVHILHLTGHAMFQHIVGIGAETQQLSHFAPQIDDTLTDLKVVLGIVVNTYRVPGHVHLLAEITLRTVGHERTIAGGIESKYPSIHFSLLSCQGCCLTSCFRQTVQLFLISDMQDERLVLFQQVLRELQREHRSLFGELTQFLLSLLIEQGTTSHKTIVAVVEQHLLLGCELTVMTMYILNAFKQFLVQSDIVGMLCQDGLYLLCQRIHLIVRLSTHQVEEHGTHPS